MSMLVHLNGSIPRPRIRKDGGLAPAARADRPRQARGHHPLDPPQKLREWKANGQRDRRSTSSFGSHPYVFAGDRPRKPLTNMAMAMVLRRLKIDVTVHGMRAAFRTWAGDHGVEFELAEQCLAHAVGNAIVQAYQRSALTERRRVVMGRWANHCAGEEMTGEVVSLRKVAVE